VGIEMMWDKLIVNKEITCGQATLMALDEALANDPRVLVFGEEVADPQGGGIIGNTKGLSNKYGSRVRSTPISEQAILGAAIGAAVAGMRPVAEIMVMNFVAVAMDQIVNHAAKIRYMSGGQISVPITIRMLAGMQRGAGGQHSDMYEAWFAHVPGLKVVAPSNPSDQKGLLSACIMDDNPCIFLESMLLNSVKGPIPASGYVVPLGKASVIKEGCDISLIGYGLPIYDAIAVAEELSQEGIDIEIIDLRTIVPWDYETVLESVSKTRRAVVLHEAVKSFGVGAEISSQIHEALFDKLLLPVQRIGSKHTPVPSSRVLERAYMWSQKEIKEVIRRAMKH
jgi:pyruvate dehydrogenase E1 component beta subunit